MLGIKQFAKRQQLIYRSQDLLKCTDCFMNSKLFNPIMYTISLSAVMVICITAENTLSVRVLVGRFCLVFTLMYFEDDARTKVKRS